MALLSATPLAPAADLIESGHSALVYIDNDFLGPGQSNIQSLIPLLRTPGVRVLGIGVVTGDAWLAEESAHVLRFLEIADRADIPVFAGAQLPMCAARMRKLAAISAAAVIEGAHGMRP